jgi:hypothetical protein
MIVEGGSVGKVDGASTIMDGGQVFVFKFRWLHGEWPPVIGFVKLA